MLDRTFKGPICQHRSDIAQWCNKLCPWPANYQIQKLWNFFLCSHKTKISRSLQKTHLELRPRPTNMCSEAILFQFTLIFSYLNISQTKFGTPSTQCFPEFVSFGVSSTGTLSLTTLQNKVPESSKLCKTKRTPKTRSEGSYFPKISWTTGPQQRHELKHRYFFTAPVTELLPLLGGKPKQDASKTEKSPSVFHFTV